MASWHPRDSIEEESSSEVEKIFAGNYMEVLQESYCSSDDHIDEVRSKENILVTRIFVHHVGYSRFIIFSTDRQTLQYRLLIKCGTSATSESTVAFLPHLIELNSTRQKFDV